MAKRSAKAIAVQAIVATGLLGALVLAQPAGTAWAATGCDGGETPGNLVAVTQGIQRELVQHGFDPGSFDGVLGARTRTQIRAYQRAARLKVDGCPNRQLLDHLSFVQPRVMATGRPVPGRTLEVQVQEELSRLGYFHGRTDGKAGPKTLAAVRKFQTDNALPVTGAIDSTLLTALKNGNPSRPGR
ncbi:Peptidoglycan binding-like domain-containing protein [uncultured Gammaproteobacteria bacterium]